MLYFNVIFIKLKCKTDLFSFQKQQKLRFKISILPNKITFADVSGLCRADFWHWPREVLKKSYSSAPLTPVGAKSRNLI